MKFALFLGGLILLIIIWFVFDFRLGQKRHFSSASRRETGIIRGDFEIFTHGKELFHDYLDEIRQASHHIHVLFYIVKDDAISQEFFGLLKDKARAGIEVRLLLDRLGSWKIKKQVVKELRDAGVHFAYSNLVKLPFLFYSTQVRNHRKISIIDGKIGYLGGFNVGKEYIDEATKLNPWRDYHLKITGESVNFLQSEFLLDWHEYGGENLHHMPAYFPKLPKGAVRHQLMPTEAGQLEDNFIRLIQKATKSIIIGTPYFIPSQKIFAELIAARHRSVSITVVVPFTADHFLVQEASNPYLRTLLEEGAVVYQYKNGFYHAKIILIDDKICDVGTANFDMRSLFLNKEINCYLYDPPFIARVAEVFKRDLKDSVPLTLATLNKPNLWRSLKERLAAVVAYFL